MNRYLWIYRPIYLLTCRSTLDRYVDRHSPGRYVDRHSDDMLVDIGRLSTDMHVGRYSFTKPSTLGRHSADTLPTLGRLSELFFLYSICSRLCCPLHLVPALSVGFVLYGSSRHHSFMTFPSAYGLFSLSSLLLQTLHFKMYHKWKSRRLVVHASTVKCRCVVNISVYHF